MIVMAVIMIFFGLLTLCIVSALITVLAWTVCDAWHTHTLMRVYDRYQDITKLEIANPHLHRMFMDVAASEELRSLTDEELRVRAMSLLIFDQFAMIYNISHRPSLPRAVISILLKTAHRIGLFRSINADRIFGMTVWDYNKDYVDSVFSNPVILRAWRQWKLGDTWRGSPFAGYIDALLARKDSVENTQAVYDACALKYADRFFRDDVIAVDAQLFDELRSYLADQGGQVLDLGCGPGLHARYWIEHDFEYTGIDISSKMLDCARKKAGVGEYVQTDMRSLPFDAATFTVVISIGSLTHLDRDGVSKCLAESYRCMTEGGVGLFFFQRGNGSDIRQYPLARHMIVSVHFLDDEEVISLLSQSGFEVLNFTERQPESDEINAVKTIAFVRKKR